MKESGKGKPEQPAATEHTPVSEPTTAAAASGQQLRTPAGQEQPVFDRVDERERQPQEMQATPDGVQAQRDRQRRLNTGRARRYRQRRREREEEARRLAQEEEREKFMREQYAQYEFSPEESQVIGEAVRRLADLFEQTLGDSQSPREDNS